MGLADRFREELLNTDIFHNHKLPQGVKINKESITPAVSIPELMQNATLKELKEKTLSKIKNTPYWNDYSAMEKESMISKYLNCKAKEMNLGLKDKSDFIKDILAII